MISIAVLLMQTNVMQVHQVDQIFIFYWNKMSKSFYSINWIIVHGIEAGSEQ